MDSNSSETELKLDERSRELADVPMSEEASLNMKAGLKSTKDVDATGSASGASAPAGIAALFKILKYFILEYGRY